MRAEYQRWAKDSTASTTASTAMTTAISTTTRARAACPVISLTTRPASTGVITPISASPTTSDQEDDQLARGTAAAKRRIRRQVPFGTLRPTPSLSPRGIDRQRIAHAWSIDIGSTSGDGNAAPTVGCSRRQPPRRADGSVLGVERRPARAAGGTGPRARRASCSSCVRDAGARAAAPWSRPPRRGRRRAARRRCARRRRRARRRGTTRDASPMRSASSAPTAAPGQADLGRARVADEVDEPLGAAEVGHEAELRLGHHEAARRRRRSGCRRRARAGSRRRSHGPAPPRC